MLVISDNLYAAFAGKAEDEYLHELRAWLGEQPELAAAIGRADYAWCRGALDQARRLGIESEDGVARFARLALLCGEGWFQSQEAKEILAHDHDDDLKLFQLECLHEGVTDG